MLVDLDGDGGAALDLSLIAADDGVLWPEALVKGDICRFTSVSGEWPVLKGLFVLFKRWTSVATAPPVLLLSSASNESDLAKSAPTRLGGLEPFDWPALVKNDCERVSLKANAVG